MSANNKTPSVAPPAAVTPPTDSAAYLGILAGVALAFQRGWVNGAEVPANAQGNLTPYQPDPLPRRLVRFRHPCHEHKFFLLVNRFPRSVVCDNVSCSRAIQFSECFASCPRCSLDICVGCFAKPLASDQIPVPLADSDSEVNDDTFFTPYRMRAKVENVKLRGNKSHRRNNGHTPAQVPTAPQNPAQTETFAGVIGPHNNHHHHHGCPHHPNDDEDPDDDPDDDEEYME